MKNPTRVVKFALAILLLTNYVSVASAQNFENGDLDGSIGSTYIPFWEKVPNTDAYCQALSYNEATPDLAGLTDPDSTLNFIGNPYSGSTFVSGLHGGYQNYFFHEGIMQSVSGLTIGQEYSIHFYQAVVKQSNSLDTSGSWSLIIDNTLAGTTSPTYSSDPINSTSLIWEEKNIEFTATSNSHLFKFLPIDDDTNNEFSETNTNGALRMGIDYISLNILTDVKESQIHSEIISIYPNPFTNQTTINFKSEQKNTLIKIIDILGNEIKTILFTGNQIILDKAEMKSGIYFLQTIDDQRQIVNKKIIIQ